MTAEELEERVLRRYPGDVQAWGRPPLQASRAEPRLMLGQPWPRHTRRRAFAMDQAQQLLALILAACFGILATLAILRRQRRTLEPPHESPFAASSEGETLCPQCGMGNQSTDDRCISCGAALPG